MKDTFGTNFITGLNVAEGPHLIGDQELRESYNGWTDEDGVWTPARSPELKHSPYTAISCFAAGRMNGADHKVWLDGNTLYDNGANVGTITAGTSMDIVALDDAFLIFGAAKNYIWDGTHLREQGAWQVAVSTDSGIYHLAKTEYTISAISKASEAKITTTGATTFVVGDYAYVDGGDMTEISGRPYRVTGIDSGANLWITVACDSTNFTTYTTGGKLCENACGLTAGEYKFYLTGIIELANGTVIEGAPIGLGRPDEQSGIAWDTSSPETFTVAAATDQLLVECLAKWTLSSVPQYVISGTVGVDYSPGLRLYRTKMDGYDWYLEKEWTYGDADFVYAAGTSAYFTGTYTVHVPDGELGAVYTAGQYDHMSAPAGTIGDVSAQVCMVNSTANPDRVYWSSLDGIEYFNTNTGWDKRPDTVTGIIGFMDGFVVFSSDRMWFTRIIDGLPDWEEIPTPVGTIWPKAMWTFDGGVVWLRDDGLWMWSGSGAPQKVSWKAFASIDEPQSVTGAGSVLYVSGSQKAFIAIRRPSGWVWHECSGSYPYASGTNGSIYAASTFQVVKLFAGVRAGGRVKSKHYGNKLQSKSVRVNLDFVGNTIPTLWINGNRQSDTDGHTEATRLTEDGRRIERISVPRLNNQYVELQFEVDGDGQLYGWEVEAAR